MSIKLSTNTPPETVAKKPAKLLPLAVLKNEIVQADACLWDSPFGWATPFDALPFRKIPPQLLLDTPVLDWLVRSPSSLSHNALRLINECESGCLVSSASWLEWAELVRSGRYVVRGSLADFWHNLTQTLRLQVVELSPEALNIYANLPVSLVEKQLNNASIPPRKLPHTNPHDLQLVAHALALKVPFLSPHAVFGQYSKAGLKWVW
jgi:PIN domain nuclease of toxin-antitoxin system